MRNFIDYSPTFIDNEYAVAYVNERYLKKTRNE